MNRYLLWDFDNTLAYREGMWSQTLLDILIENGYSTTKLEDIRIYLNTGFPWNSYQISHQEFFKGMSWWGYMNLYLKNILMKLGYDEDISINLSNAFKNKYLDINKWCVYDDVIPCLEKVSTAGYTNIILSNHVPELATLVEGLGLRKYFKKIYNSANIGYEKPNPNIYRKVINDLNTNNIIMIGDNYHADVQGAVDVGLKAILVRKENINNYQPYSKTLDNILTLLETSLK